MAVKKKPAPASKRKATASRTAAHAAPAAPAAPAQVAPAAPAQVAMLLNGQSIGMVAPDGKTIGEVAMEIARSNGLKSYAILVDGVKVLSQDASKGLKGASSIEVFAKETRG